MKEPELAIEPQQLLLAEMFIHARVVLVVARMEQLATVAITVALVHQLPQQGEKALIAEAVRAVEAPKEVVLVAIQEEVLQLAAILRAVAVVAAVPVALILPVAVPLAVAVATHPVVEEAAEEVLHPVEVRQEVVVEDKTIAYI